ncbi:MAG TPA: tetratricopeptide repeat protein [Pyrinomonadaceae bacterium]|nr:tetratricopeptide repeat protein [Pyrinomonadaceae bacterium]
MKKESIMFGVFGLIVGLVIGFMGANNLNRQAAGQIAQAPAGSTAAPAGNPNLPADHPPIGTTGAGQPQSGAPLPQVTEAIDKAKQQPQNYEAQMTAADLYYQIQRFEDAAKFYEIAAKLKPGESEPMIKAGNAYFDGEKYEQAEKWYLQALQKDPKDINVRTDLGLTFFLRTPRDIDRAIKEYKTSLETDPNHEITLQNLALAYTENGDKEALVKTLERLKKVNPNNPVIKKAETN